VAEKSERQRAIREIVTARAVASQEELRRQLAKRGWDVTQSTLSRDLRELRLARIPDDSGGVRYAFSEGNGADDTSSELEAMLPALLTGAEGVGVLVVARTRRSGAQPVAEALDMLEWPDVMGTIAGDDTVLLICRSAGAGARVVKRLRTYIRPHA
jgi:transcriptional regulator of arginine metabolism